MKSLLLLALLGTLVFRETSQQCNVNNQQSCYDCRSEPGRCCNLDLPNNPDNTTYPLGYQSFSIPGADSSDPDPCVRISVSGTINNTAIFYLIMAAETTGTRLCMRIGDNDGTCGSGPVYFCQMIGFTNDMRSVDVILYCDSSCEVNSPSFYLKSSLQVLQNDVENFCDNVDEESFLLPSSLNQNIGVEITQAERTEQPTSSSHKVSLSLGAIALAFLTLALK